MKYAIQILKDERKLLTIRLKYHFYLTDEEPKVKIAIEEIDKALEILKQNP
jgi:hypothetical protein